MRSEIGVFYDFSSTHRHAFANAHRMNDILRLLIIAHKEWDKVIAVVRRTRWVGGVPCLLAVFSDALSAEGGTEGGVEAVSRAHQCLWCSIQT